MKNGPEKGRSLMEQSALTAVIKAQSRRAFWEVKNVIDCIPDGLWEREYCCAPLWKHVYHMLHSLDLWMINPRDKEFSEPEFHEKDLNDLDAVSRKTLSRKELEAYFFGIERKLARYLEELTDRQLPDCPEGCEYTRFTLILAQFRHLHSHMGMIMGFLIADTGKWPRVLGLEGAFPDGEYDKFF